MASIRKVLSTAEKIKRAQDRAAKKAAANRKERQATQRKELAGRVRAIQSRTGTPGQTKTKTKRERSKLTTEQKDFLKKNRRFNITNIELDYGKKKTRNSGALKSIIDNITFDTNTGKVSNIDNKKLTRDTNQIINQLVKNNNNSKNPVDVSREYLEDLVKAQQGTAVRNATARQVKSVRRRKGKSVSPPITIDPRKAPFKQQELELTKIISGGQVGADEAGLIAGAKLRQTPEFEHLQLGGTLTRGNFVDNESVRRLSKDKYNNPEYGFKESTQKGYTDRTEKNVQESDGTVIFTDDAAGGINSPGTQQTINLLKKSKKPYIINPTPGQLNSFLTGNNELSKPIRTLNVAGNRNKTNNKETPFTQRVEDTIVEAVRTPTEQRNIYRELYDPKDQGIVTFTDREGNVVDARRLLREGILSEADYNRAMGRTTGRFWPLRDPASPTLFGKNVTDEQIGQRVRDSNIQLETTPTVETEDLGSIIIDSKTGETRPIGQRLTYEIDRKGTQSQIQKDLRTKPQVDMDPEFESMTEIVPESRFTLGTEPLINKRAADYLKNLSPQQRQIMYANRNKISRGFTHDINKAIKEGKSNSEINQRIAEKKLFDSVFIRGGVTERVLSPGQGDNLRKMQSDYTSTTGKEIFPSDFDDPHTIDLVETSIRKDRENYATLGEKAFTDEIVDPPYPKLDRRKTGEKLEGGVVTQELVETFVGPGRGFRPHKPGSSVSLSGMSQEKMKELYSKGYIRNVRTQKGARTNDWKWTRKAEQEEKERAVENFLNNSNLVRKDHSGNYIWTEHADRFYKNFSNKENKKYVDRLKQLGFAETVTVVNPKTGKKKRITKYTKDYHDFITAQQQVRGEPLKESLETRTVFDENDPDSIMQMYESMGGEGSINPEDVVQDLENLGHKVTRKHGGKIKTKSRPKPKILQGGRVSNNKRPVGVGAAKRGFGAVRRV